MKTGNKHHHNAKMKEFGQVLCGVWFVATLYTAFVALLMNYIGLVL